MTDPAPTIQIAVSDALKRAAPLQTMIKGRVYDMPPSTAPGATTTFPYVTIGEGQTIPERADCLDGSEHFFTVHVWSRAVGYLECKRIASAIRDCLHDAVLDLDSFALLDLALLDAQFMRDPDGLTSHCALQFRALVEPTD